MSRRLDALKAVTGGTGNTYTQVLESSQTLINDDSSGGGSLDSLFNIISIDYDETNNSYSPHGYDTIADFHADLLLMIPTNNCTKIPILKIYTDSNNFDVAIANHMYVMGQDEICIQFNPSMMIDNYPSVQIAISQIQISSTEITLTHDFVTIKGDNVTAS